MKRKLLRPLYYKRNGRPYTGKTPVLEWAKDIEDEKLRVVVQDKLWNGIFVSTIWLGLDNGWGLSKRPLIFETMVFSPNGSSLESERFSTEEEAKDFHIQQVKKWRSIESVWPLCRNMFSEWLYDIQDDVRRLERAFKKGSKDAKKHGSS